MLTPCDHCGEKGYPEYHELKMCNECAGMYCKVCASDWQDDTNGTVCRECAKEVA